MHSSLKLNKKLVMQNLRRQPQSSVTVRCFCKWKNCCHVIAISLASIAAPTLTEMQGFQGKKEHFVHLLSPILSTPSIIRVFPFHAFGTQGASHAKLKRELHSSVTIRRFRKLKSCCYVIAIPSGWHPCPNPNCNARF